VYSTDVCNSSVYVAVLLIFDHMKLKGLCPNGILPINNNDCNNNKPFTRGDRRRNWGSDRRADRWRRRSSKPSAGHRSSFPATVNI